MRVCTTYVHKDKGNLLLVGGVNDEVEYQEGTKRILTIFDCCIVAKTYYSMG